MAITLDGTNGITFNNSTVQASAGQVLQVVQGSYAAQVGPITTTYTDSGLSASITPKFSTSKILVMVNQALYVGGGGADSGAGLRILRGATEVFATSATTLYIYSSTLGNEIGTIYSINYLDSPATTSSTTYKTQGIGQYGANLYMQVSSNPSILTLMEIAA
jgi:hypothetical protein